MAAKDEGADDDSITGKSSQNAQRAVPSQKKYIFISLVPLLAIFVLLSRFYYSDTILLTPHTPSSQPSSKETTTAPLGDGDDQLLPQNGQLHPKSHVHRPETTHNLEWRISAGLRRPDGVQKRVYLINDQFPGPSIEARTGDTLEILVHNDLEDEALSLHWHGLYMRDANVMDGAMGVTQCGLQPGESFLYNFTISNDQSGTFWYHAHSAVQRADGLYGGLVVHKPASTPHVARRHEDASLDVSNYQYDQDILLLIGDWYHRPAPDVADRYLWWGSMGYEPVPDSMLINGAGRFNCSMASPGRPVDCSGEAVDRPTLALDSRSSYRVRVVNTGSLSGITLTFARETLEIITLDGGVAVEPPRDAQDINSAGTLFPGQRMDFILRPPVEKENLDKPSSLRIDLDESDFKIGNPSLAPSQVFPIIKKTSATNDQRQSESDDDEFLKTLSDVEHRHFIDIEKLPSASSVLAAMPPAAQQTHLVYAKVEKLSRLMNIPHGFFNRTTWQMQSDPAYPLIGLARNRWDKHQLALVTGPEPVWIDFVVNNLDDGAHPFHLHGHNFYVLATYRSVDGWGSYDPWDTTRPPPGLEDHVSTDEDADGGGPFDLSRAVLRDTVQIPRRGYAVLRLRADNPGVWLFHCHVMWHLAGGMAMVVDVMNGDETVAHRPEIAATEDMRCRV